MALYTYKKLVVEDQEIRLMRLMPGETDEDIYFAILHAPLIPPKPMTNLTRPSIEKVQQTLPEDWLVRETLEGRYLFLKMGTSGTPNSWDHPDPNFDNSSIHLLQSQQLPDFEPKYEALSYTWGTNVDLVTAHVVDPFCPKQSQSAIQIGSNLACALKYLRYRDEPRTMWVDAVCINQADIDERNAQVKRMGMIYSLARRAVIWLGPEAEDSKHALSTLNYFGNQVEYTMDNHLGDSPGATEPRWFDPSYILPYDEKTWSCLIALFRRPWFSRVWVLQETLLSSQQSLIQCGDTSCPWSTFRKAIILFAEKDGIPRWLRSWLDSYRIAFLGNVTRSLPRLLLWASQRQCTDPHDKVYGILSLLSPSISEKIDPQYSAPISQLYMNTFLAHLDFERRLSLLPQCNIEQRYDGGPSWVPNWAGDSKIPFSHRFGYARQSSGLSTAHTRFLPPNTLEVVGKRCARICSVSSSAPYGSDDILLTIQQWEPEGLQTKGYVSGGSLLDAFLEVVSHGQTRERQPSVKYFPTLEDLRKKYLAMLSGHSCDDDDLRYFQKGLKVDGESLLTTQEGYLGIAAPGAKEDDYVCILLGCDRPMLLRPTTSGDFLIVGPCFVHGLMDAESILGAIPDPWQMKMRKDDGRVYKPYFYNISTGKILFEDPRLPPLSSEWEIIERKRTHEDPSFFKDFRNIISGETLNSDPRMLPDALEERGVKLETFRLV